MKLTLGVVRGFEHALRRPSKRALRQVLGGGTRALAEDERGSVTLEFALCLPLVVFFIGLVALVANYSAAHGTCQQVAEVLAREAIMREGSEQDVEEMYRIVEDDFGASVENIRYSVQYNEAWVDVQAQYNDPQSPFGFIVNGAKSELHARLER